MRQKAGTDADYWTHDLGKHLFFFGSQGKWDVVRDTFTKFPDFTHVATFIHIIITTFCEQ